MNGITARPSPKPAARPKTSPAPAIAAPTGFAGAASA